MFFYQKLPLFNFSLVFSFRATVSNSVVQSLWNLFQDTSCAGTLTIFHRHEKTPRADIQRSY